MPEPTRALHQATVLHRERTIRLDDVQTEADELFITPSDLPRINNFRCERDVVCLADIRLPLRGLLVSRGGTTWLHLTKMARVLHQACVVDRDLAVWSFSTLAPDPDALRRTRAPDFALPNLDGDVVRLSDFRAKKVLLLAWASW